MGPGYSYILWGFTQYMGPGYSYILWGFTQYMGPCYSYILWVFTQIYGPWLVVHFACCTENASCNLNQCVVDGSVSCRASHMIGQWVQTQGLHVWWSVKKTTSPSPHVHYNTPNTMDTVTFLHLPTSHLDTLSDLLPGIQILSRSHRHETSQLSK